MEEQEIFELIKSGKLSMSIELDGDIIQSEATLEELRLTNLKFGIDPLTAMFNKMAGDLGDYVKAKKSEEGLKNVDTKEESKEDSTKVEDLKEDSVEVEKTK